MKPLHTQQSDMVPTDISATLSPQSEVLETLAELRPWETTGMVVLQAESEVAAINMVYGGAATGKP